MVNGFKKKLTRPMIEKNLKIFGEQDKDGSDIFMEEEMQSYESMSSIDSYDDKVTIQRKRKMTHRKTLNNKDNQEIIKKQSLGVLSNAAKFLAFLKRKEKDIEKRKKRCLIDPESKFKIFWDHL